MKSEEKRCKERWVAKNGSIFCERSYSVKTEYNTKYMTQDSIAFNVGEKVAEHIVALHNASLPHIPNAVTMQAIEDCRNGNVTSFDSVEDLMKDLND